MHRISRAIVTVLIFLLLPLSLKAQETQVAQGNTIAPERAKSIIAVRARETITALKNGDMKKLAAIAHPTKGVRFTPYNYVDTKEDLVFHPSQLKSLMTSKKRYVWGSYDGSGDPIRLTFKKYYQRFIYDADFARMKDVSYNDSQMTNTNYDNAYEIYPNSIIVGYFFAGSKRYDGMDWRGLRLVFQPKGGTWYLVGVMHNEWTI